MLNLIGQSYHKDPKLIKIKTKTQKSQLLTIKRFKSNLKIYKKVWLSLNYNKNKKAIVLKIFLNNHH